MENKQPKEIFICGNKLDNIYLLEKMSIYDIKYISSTHHNEIVEGLEAENEHNIFYINQLLNANERLIAEIESLKSKSESKRKHWNTK